MTNKDEKNFIQISDCLTKKKISLIFPSKKTIFVLTSEKYLETREDVTRVSYPGLEKDPGHEVAKKQMRGFGGMITFYIKGAFANTSKFLSSLKLFILAESLGGVESLAEAPVCMTHGSVPPEMRKILGIDDTLIRLSCGIEDTEDLLEDMVVLSRKVVFYENF